MGKRLKSLLFIFCLIFVAAISFFLGSLGSSNQATSKDYLVDKKLADIKKIIDSRYLYDIDEDKMKEGIYKGYVQSLNDPYTVYYTKEEYLALNQDTEGSFGGVGIEVNGSGPLIQVVAPIKDTPADRAGIKAGDRIFSINGVEYTGEQMQDAVSVMRGEPGEAVKLTILRDVNGKEEKMDFEIIREIINVESVHSQVLDNNIGYIHITNFQAHTAEDFKKAWKELKDKNVKGIVLDLRNNPGGLLDVTIEIADMLLPEGPVMKVKYADGSEDAYNSEKEADTTSLVTLINGGSASASEVLSGALKDYKRGELVGETSFGKGVVQQIIDLSDGSGVKVTMAEFFTPQGNKIHKEGIKPTIEIKLPDEVSQIGPESLKDDVQLQKAIEILNK